jgi:hypothetical protein
MAEQWIVRVFYPDDDREEIGPFELYGDADKFAEAFARVRGFSYQSGEKYPERIENTPLVDIQMLIPLDWYRRTEPELLGETVTPA